MSKKAFKFNYFFIKVYNGETEKYEWFRFAEFVAKFLDLSNAERVIDIYDYKAKIEGISQIQERFIHINLVKMTDKAFPKKVFDDERASLDIEFENDEYLGTDVHMLYDMNNKVLMLQRTRESLSEKNISCYINEFAHKINILSDKEVLEILPIYDTNNISSNSIVKKIDIRFANVENAKVAKHNNISQLLKLFNKFNAISGTITMSVSRKKQALNADEVMNAVKTVEELKSTYKDCVSGAKLSYVENDVSYSLDLFDDIMKDIGQVEVNPRESIKFEEIESEMMRIYFKKLPHLNSVIGYN